MKRPGAGGAAATTGFAAGAAVAASLVALLFDVGVAGCTVVVLGGVGTGAAVGACGCTLDDPTDGAACCSAVASPVRAAAPGVSVGAVAAGALSIDWGAGVDSVVAGSVVGVVADTEGAASVADGGA